jgi:DNA-binding transcriptional LysR family regulator
VRSERLEVREFATLQLMYEAAVAGLGVALGLPLLAEPGLASGRLVACAGAPRLLGETYRLYRAPGLGPRSPAEQRFTRWLRSAVGESLHRFDGFVAAASNRTLPSEAARVAPAAVL